MNNNPNPPDPNIKRHGGALPVDDTPWRHLLGTMPDSKIARRFGVARITVQRRREARNIPAWTPDRAWEALAGTMPDGDVAKIGKVHPETVRRHRIDTGIPAFGAEARDTGPQPWHADLSTMGNAAIVQKWRVDWQTVRNARRRLMPRPEPAADPVVPLSEWIGLAGTMSDTDLGRIVQLSADRVRQRRIAAGIPAFVAKKAAPAPVRRPIASVTAAPKPATPRTPRPPPKPSIPVREQLRQREEAPDEKAPVRQSMITPTVAGDGGCTFEDGCLCFLCRKEARKAPIHQAPARAPLPPPLILQWDPGSLTPNPDDLPGRRTRVTP